MKLRTLKRRTVARQPGGMPPLPAGSWWMEVPPNPWAELLAPADKDDSRLFTTIRGEIGRIDGGTMILRSPLGPGHPDYERAQERLNQQTRQALTEMIVSGESWMQFKQDGSAVTATVIPRAERER